MVSRLGYYDLLARASIENGNVEITGAQKVRREPYLEPDGLPYEILH
jgi:hypothetical protein